ncbi:MAG TPA: hypothetical protein VFK46_07485 [Candidatus Macondimonas sp.]|nr:hypothetical protein [Candidatus Macondimonas sp.]
MILEYVNETAVLYGIDLSGYLSRVRVDFGVENLFDTLYNLPTGGAYVGQGTTMGLNSIPWGIAVPGLGRTVYAGILVVRLRASGKRISMLSMP